MMRKNNVIRLLSTRHLSREQWLAVRSQGIGSSDAAAAVGLSPYTSPLALWLEKTGRKPAEDLSQSEAVFWGTTLEAIIAQVYAARTGHKVRRVNAVLQHSEHPFMLANLDRAVGTDGILEVKTAGGHSAKFWEDGVPEHYQCQVIHQLAVTGKAWADVAVLIAGQDFRIYRIPRDEAQIADLIAREQVFWAAVETEVPPAVDGSDSSAQALSWLYPRDNGQHLDATQSPRLEATFRELVQMRQDIAVLAQAEALLRQEIQSAMGSASTAVFSRGRVSWKSAKDSLRLDTCRLQAEHPALLAPYQETVAGVRRFLIQAETSEMHSDAGSISGQDSVRGSASDQVLASGLISASVPVSASAPVSPSLSTISSVSIPVPASQAA